MRHPFMEAMAERLAHFGIATMRYEFPYMEKGARRPDPQGLLTSTVREALNAARRMECDLPILAGGKSMGGRMTSLAAAEEPLPGVRGLVFLGFPLHAAGRPSVDRSAHLSRVSVPMLFLQGTRDDLADLQLLEPVCHGLGQQRVRLHVVDGADHSFHVPKRSGRSDTEVIDELARTISTWASTL